MNNKKYIRDEILVLIARYENKVRGIENSIAEAERYGETRDTLMLVSRREAYRLDMIPDLKRLLELAPERKTASIIQKFDGEEYVYGTYDFNTSGEKCRVNELALQLRHEKFCDVEVRVNE